MNISEIHALLNEHGWALIPEVAGVEGLLALAASIGPIIPNGNGEPIKTLRPTSMEQARPGTLSGLYGTGAFPFHTDTAFWVVPARYVVLRCEQDSSMRPTRICSFKEVLNAGGSSFCEAVGSSIWRVGKVKSPFYCTMSVNCGDPASFRFDADCMNPANGAALAVRDLFHQLTQKSHVVDIKWVVGDTLVIDNWTSLHARGSARSIDGTRTLQRVYIGAT